MIYFYLECDALDNDIRSLFMAFYPGRAIKRIETKEYACAEGDLFLRVCMSDCAETQCLANEDNTKKKMTMELMQDGTLLEDNNADGHVLVVSDYEPGADYVYYWGFAWDRADIKTAEAWNRYMADFAQKVRNPMTVSIR